MNFYHPIKRVLVGIALIASLLVFDLSTNEQSVNAAACSGSDYSSSDSGSTRTVTFTNASSCTFTLPDGVTSISYVVVGGGGGGGGGVSTGQNSGGSGGRGGQIVEASGVAVASGTALTLTVGGGGNGGAAARSGVSGSNSSLNIFGGASVTALGGNRGSRGSTKTNNSGSGTGTGGKGAGNSNADAGGNGLTNAINASTYAGGGGGGASASRSSASGGAGGGGAGGSSGSAGSVGTVNTGGGGGGGGGHATAAGAGGAGGKGVVVIQFTRDTTAPTVTLARTSATSISSSIFFTVTGNEAIQCSDLSTTNDVDFLLTNMSISAIQQDNPTMCTITGLSTAVSGGSMVTSTISKGASFSISDLAGNAQTSTLTSSPQSINVTIPSTDNTAPTVTGVTSSTNNGGYKAGDAISIQVSFSEVVTVSGTPTLTLETGSTDRTINYASGSGLTILTFTYTVQSGDTSGDLDYASTSALSAGDGTIQDSAGNNATLTLASPGVSHSLGANKAIVIDTTAPAISYVIGGTNATYYAEESVAISVVFSENVSFTGTPSLQLETGTTDQYAYTQGTNGSSLLLSYTVVCGDSTSDLNYLSTSALELSGGTITDSVGNTATLTLPSTTDAANSLKARSAIVVSGSTLDGSTTCSAAPIVTGVSSSTTNGSYKSGGTISIQVTFDISVSVTGTPTLTLETGSIDRILDYVSGSDSTSLTFTYVVQAGDTSSDLDYVSATSLSLNGGSIVRTSDGITAAALTLPVPGASGSLGVNKALVIDTTAPTASWTAPSSPSSSRTLSYTLTFSESVSGVASADFSNAGTATGCSFTPDASSGTSIVVAVVCSSDGTVVAWLASGSVSDTAGNTGPSSNASASSVTINTSVPDTTAPTVSSISSSTSDGSYKSGISISIQVSFSEVVVVTGTPTLTLETGSTDRTINYVSGSGTVSLTFTYVVQAGDYSSDLDYVSVTSLALNGGTIKDAANNSATLSLPAPGASGSLGTNKALVIDTTAPTATWTEPSSPSSSRTLSYTLVFSESVSGVASADFSNAGTATGCSFTPDASSGTSIVVAVVCSSDGTVVARLASGSVSDTAGNTGPSSNASASSVTINTSIPDTTAPTLISSTPSDNATGIAVGVNIELTFSESISAVNSKNIYLKKTSGTEEIFSLPSAKVSVSGSSVIINPTGNLDNNTTYWIEIESGAFKDSSDNVFAGISSSTTLNFTTVSAGGDGTTTTTVAATTTTVAATTTTIQATVNATSTTVAQQVVNNSRRISICHATSSATNPYVLITVDRNSLNGHGIHGGDLIPAPAGGCPSPVVTTVGSGSSSSSSSTTTISPRRINICHATSAGFYVAITVDKNGLNGHGDHLDDLIPAPEDGCPYSVRQFALQLVSSTTTTAVIGSGGSTTSSALPAGKVDICHATAAGFYVEITVDRSGLNGHGDHEGDIISAPAGGCPTTVQKQAAPTTTTAPGKISICHATGAGFFVGITVDRSGLNGHGDHEGDLVPAPADGCPSRVESFSSPTTSSVPAGKTAICHATSGGSLELVLVNKGQLGDHSSHGQDLIPAPAGGCSNPSTNSSTSTSIPCINARELENYDESKTSLTEGVKVDAKASSDDPQSGTIKILTPGSGPALSLVSAESVDPGIKVTVKSSGVDYNKAITWVNEGYGKFCWKIEPFGDKDYIYSLPNPPAPPDARYAGFAYSTVVVKAGSITTTDPSYQVNTLFYSPTAGTGVFADVNKNGVSDPGGQGGGTLGDKAISHVIVCVGEAEFEVVGSTTTIVSSSSTSPFLTTTTTINWSADFCPEPTTTTTTPDESSTTTTTTSTPSSTTTASPSSTLITSTTNAGPSDPNPPIEFIVETQRVPESGYTDLVLTVTDGETSEVVFLQVDIRNFKVIAQSLPATGQSKYLPEQKYGLALLALGLGLMLAQLRRRSIRR